VRALNPCPCGYFGDGSERCICDPTAVGRYAGRVVGPLLHRIDLHVDVVAVKWSELTARLALAGIEPSAGSRGDSYNNALAESVIGLFETEVIRRRGPWWSLEDVELATRRREAPAKLAALESGALR